VEIARRRGELEIQMTQMLQQAGISHTDQSIWYAVPPCASSVVFPRARCTPRARYGVHHAHRTLYTTRTVRFVGSASALWTCSRRRLSLHRRPS
jgi:hypothetical protein